MTAKPLARLAGLVSTRVTGRRRTILLGVVAVVAAMTLVVALLLRGPSDPIVIVGVSPTTSSALPAPTAPLEDPTTLPPPDLGRPSLPEPGPAVGLKVANGQPAKPAIPFTSSIPVPDHLVFVLVIGSDARPREDLLATRADSLHLLALNPATGQGTIVGFPRDSYVQFPNGGRGKINDALARGGPRFVAETVRQLSGLPVDYYVLTGFVGLQKMVDELGGVDVHVDRRMNDKFSGARFERGWHHFVGGEALSFSRNRHDVANGDFSRSENQATLLLAALGKLRSEVSDEGGLLHWLGVLSRNCRLDVPADQLPRLAALARRIAPERIANVVLPGRVGYAGSASVVYLTQDAPRLFADLRDDAVIGGAAPPTTVEPTTTIEAPSTTTTAPTTTTTGAPPPPTVVPVP
jgi:LCP family protein required for cell wall assembly